MLFSGVFIVKLRKEKIRVLIEQSLKSLSKMTSIKSTIQSSVKRLLSGKDAARKKTK